MKKIGVIIALAVLALGMQACGGAEKCPAYSSSETLQQPERA
jgi:hypothetical protein